MSTEVKTDSKTARVTRFNGGQDRGMMVQVTVGNNFVQMNMDDAWAVAQAMMGVVANRFEEDFDT